MNKLKPLFFVTLSILLSPQFSAYATDPAKLADYTFAKDEAQISEFFKRSLGAYENNLTEYGSYLVIEQYNAKVRSDTFKYDSIMVTLAAGLESRGYERGEFKETLVKMSDNSKGYYQQPVRLYHKFRRTKADQKLPVVISLGSSFSTWNRGTWTNKTVALVEKNLNSEVHIIGMPGFLTTEVLSFKPKFPDLNGDYIARDLRQRILALIKAKADQGYGVDMNRIYITGYSGGATIALAMAAVDDDFKEPLITGGVLAFSPIVDLQAANFILDKNHKVAKAKGVNGGLTTVGTILKNLASSNSHQSVISLQGLKDAENTDKRENLSHLFFNEFTIVDLKTVAKSSQSLDFKWGEWIKGNGGNTYYEYFELYAFNRLKDMNLLSERSFSRATDVVPLWKQIRTKNLIVFATDDPVLATDVSSGKVVEKVEGQLRRLRKEAPHLNIFSPERGGHMGYFLDTKWLSGTLGDFLKD
jgi:pimeloyl-ACP methyl ester carboxylesterase